MRYIVQGRSKFTGFPMDLRLEARDMGDALERGRQLGLIDIRASSVEKVERELHWSGLARDARKNAAA